MSSSRSSSSSSPSSSSSSSSSMSILVEDNAQTSQLDDATKCPVCANRYDAEQHRPIFVADTGLALTVCHKCVQRAISSTARTSSSIDAPLPLRNQHMARIPLTSLDEPNVVVDVAALAQANALVVAQNRCCTDDCRASAVQRCDVCVESYCAEHAKWHSKMSALRSHVLVDINARDAKDGASLGIALASAVATCPLHAHRRAPEYLHWCNECKVPLCVHCKADHVREHPTSDLAQAARAAHGQKVIDDTLEHIQSMVASCAHASDSALKRSHFFDAHCVHVVVRLNDFKARVVELVDAEIKRTQDFSRTQKQSVDAHKKRLDASLASLSSQLRAMQAARDAARQATRGANQEKTPLMVASRVREVLQRVEREVQRWHREDDYQSVQFGLDKTVTKATATSTTIVGEMNLGASRAVLEATALVSELKKQLKVEMRMTSEDDQVLAAIIDAVGAMPERQERERAHLAEVMRKRWGLELRANVTELNLSSKNIDTEGCRIVAAALRHVPQLASLDLRDNKIGDEGCHALISSLHRVPQLIYLDLRDNGLYIECGEAILARLPRLPRLTAFGGVTIPRAISSKTMLALSRMSLGPVEMAVIAASLQHAPRLTSLDVARNNIGDAGYAALTPFLHHVPLLTSLDLTGNSISGHAIASSLQHVPQLTSLNVSHNSICDQGCCALASSLQHVPQLRSLSLSHNISIGTNAFRALTASLELKYVPQLTELNLSGNIYIGGYITEEDRHTLARFFVSALHNVPHLTSLDMSNIYYIYYEKTSSHDTFAAVYQVLPRLTTFKLFNTSYPR